MRLKRTSHKIHISQMMFQFRELPRALTVMSSVLGPSMLSSYLGSRFVPSSSKFWKLSFIILC